MSELVNGVITWSVGILVAACWLIYLIDWIEERLLQRVRSGS